MITDELRLRHEEKLRDYRRRAYERAKTKKVYYAALRKVPGYRKLLREHHTVIAELRGLTAQRNSLWGEIEHIRFVTRQELIKAGKL